MSPLVTLEKLPSLSFILYRDIIFLLHKLFQTDRDVSRHYSHYFISEAVGQSKPISYDQPLLLLTKVLKPEAEVRSTVRLTDLALDHDSLCFITMSQSTVYLIGYSTRLITTFKRIL